MVSFHTLSSENYFFILDGDKDVLAKFNFAGKSPEIPIDIFQIRDVLQHYEEFEKEEAAAKQQQENFLKQHGKIVSRYVS